MAFSPSVLLLYPNTGQVPKDHLSVMQSCWSPKVPFPDLWSSCFPISTSWSPKAGTHDRQRKCYIQVHLGKQVPFFFVLFVWLLVYIQEHELEFAYWRLGDSKTVAWPKSSTQAQPSRRCINRTPLHQPIHFHTLVCLWRLLQLGGIHGGLVWPNHCVRKIQPYRERLIVLIFAMPLHGLGPRILTKGSKRMKKIQT